MISRMISSHGYRLELTSVQSTSLLVAYWRDLESQKLAKDALISDPTATQLIKSLLTEKARQEYEASPILEVGIEALAVRTRFIDDWLLDRCTCTVDQERSKSREQIVNLGAGMCGRPYRLHLDERENTKTTFFEIDSDPSLLKIKQKVLNKCGFPELCKIVHVGADLRNAVDTAVSLQQEGFDGNKCTDWIAEGLFEYMDPVVHQPLLKMAFELGGPYSRMTIQILEPSVGEFFTERGVKMPWRKLVDAQYIADQAKEVGWINYTIVDTNTLNKTYNRNLELQGFKMVCLEKK